MKKTDSHRMDRVSDRMDGRWKPARAGRGHFLLATILVAALSTMLAGCPPPPHRGAPPAPPKPPGVYVPPSQLPTNNFGNLQV